jgi:RimJ/RimL family protein N-acetyltransferase
MRASQQFDDVVARGRKTVVRSKRAGDVRDEYEWRSDRQLAEFDASRPVQIPFANYQRNWSFDFRYTDMPRRSFAIEDFSGRHIGNVMYYNYDEARAEAEIGISIGERPYWEGGYGSDALRALVTHLFEYTLIERLYLHTLDWNIRARRCFEKVGFIENGVSWRDGRTFIMMELRRQPAGFRSRLPREPVTV